MFVTSGPQRKATRAYHMETATQVPFDKAAFLRETDRRLPGLVLKGTAPRRGGRRMSMCLHVDADMHAVLVRIGGCCKTLIKTCGTHGGVSKHILPCGSGLCKDCWDHRRREALRSAVSWQSAAVGTVDPGLDVAKAMKGTAWHRAAGVTRVIVLCAAKDLGRLRRISSDTRVVRAHEAINLVCDVLSEAAVVLDGLLGAFEKGTNTVRDARAVIKAYGRYRKHLRSSALGRQYIPLPLHDLRTKVPHDAAAETPSITQETICPRDGCHEILEHSWRWDDGQRCTPLDTT